MRLECVSTLEILLEHFWNRLREIVPCRQNSVFLIVAENSIYRPKLRVCAWARRLGANGRESEFMLFMKVVALDLSFHLPQVPCHSELRNSRYGQNTGHTSWCKLCWFFFFFLCFKPTYNDAIFSLFNCGKH